MLNFANAPEPRERFNGARSRSTSSTSTAPRWRACRRCSNAGCRAGGEGGEYVARNPTRHDRRPGSFKVNLRTGRWADFATGDRGGDPVSLAAYLFGLTQAEAARRLADMLGVR